MTHVGIRGDPTPSGGIGHLVRALPVADAARAAGEQVIANLQLASHLANIGDARTLVLHPASTTHRQLTAEQLVAGGVRPDLIRISVGLEDVEDILWDLDQAITAATGRSREEQA